MLVRGNSSRLAIATTTTKKPVGRFLPAGNCNHDDKETSGAQPTAGLGHKHRATCGFRLSLFLIRCSPHLYAGPYPLRHGMPHIREGCPCSTFVKESQLHFIFFSNDFPSAFAYDDAVDEEPASVYTLHQGWIIQGRIERQGSPTHLCQEAGL
jgi:hypothetical protein